MTTETLAAALEREHHDIDDGIASFLAGGQDDSLDRAVPALRRHIYLEEEFLFPPLRDAGMFAPIFVMVREHGEIWDTLDGIEAELSAGAARRSVAEICRTLLEQLERHNSKEEPILYPQADSVLTAAATASLKAFIAAGRLPEGWTCAQAGAAVASREWS